MEVFLGSGSFSVQEALAGFFPAARCAPLIAVLDAVNLAAFLGFAAGFPGKKKKKTREEFGFSASGFKDGVDFLGLEPCASFTWC